MSLHTKARASTSTIESLLYPVHNERDLLRRNGIHPRDHARDNKHFIKQLQNSIADKKAASLQANLKAEQKRLAQRAAASVHVHSRVASNLERPATA